VTKPKGVETLEQQDFKKRKEKATTEWNFEKVFQQFGKMSKSK
jgi:hypothetical protein